MVRDNIKNIRLVTGMVRFHYVNLFEPRESLEGSAPKYGICLIIPKEDKKTVDSINKAIVTEMELGEELWKDRVMANMMVPLRDGDLERADRPEFKGCYFINATTKYKPEVVDENCFIITDPEEVYPGCYGRASLRFFPYSREGNYGIGCCLHNVQKLEDGERLAVRISAADDFESDDN